MSESRAAAGNGAVLAPLIKGRFRIVGTTTSRPEAVVYSADDLTTGQPVAVEVLRGEFAADAKFVTAVRDQAYRLAKPECAHRALVRVHECDVTDDGEVYVVLDPVAGPSLREVIDARGALDYPSALRLAIQVGEALETLHNCGIVHGEVRPESILLVRDEDGGETVKLTGAALTSARRTAIGLGARDDSVTAYLAPEQIDGGPTTEATDVHGLGLVIHELLTAERPSPGGARARRNLSAAVRRIVDKALAVRPDERYSNLSVMLNDLWSAQSEPPKRGVTERLGVRRSRGINGPQPSLAVIVMAIAGLTSLAVGGWIGLSGRLVAIEPAQSGPSRAPAPVTVPIPPPLSVESAPAAPSAHPAAAVEAPPAPKPPVKPVVPAIDRPMVIAPRPLAPVAVSRPRRPETQEAEPRGPEAGDGAAIIDWLLKDRGAD